jgi:23S rRNA pseudouridine2605 synthase
MRRLSSEWSRASAPASKRIGRSQESSSPRSTRLQKLLSEAGVASRREAEDLIRQGRITVNGRRAELGQRADPDVDVVEVDGSRVRIRRDKTYLIVNKPKGVITTLADPEGRRTVRDLIRVPERVFPVGRLDADTEGLLLMTDDGDLAHRLTHPSFEITKHYVAEVEGAMTQAKIKRLMEGVKIDRGRKARPQKVRIKNVKGNKSVVEVSIHEGRKHVVRLMLAEVGHPVRKLVRTGFGSLRLGGLRPGTYRELAQDEINELYKDTGL